MNRENKTQIYDYKHLFLNKKTFIRKYAIAKGRHWLKIYQDKVEFKLIIHPFGLENSRNSATSHRAYNQLQYIQGSQRYTHHPLRLMTRQCIKI